VTTGQLGVLSDRARRSIRTRAAEIKVYTEEVTVSRFTSSILVGIGLVLSGCGENADAPTAPETAPELVASSAAAALTFSAVAVGGFHTCGVASDNRAFCWGLNDNGQLGDGTTKQRWRPTLVARGLQWAQIDGGTYHSCGVTTANMAYCWGLNDFGQLGFGGLSGRVRPVAVAGGLPFRQVSAGPIHSCAITTDNRAYCWGANFAGQLGDGTTSERHSPVPVAGGLRFRRIRASGYTCGVTTDDKAYCWGGDHHVPTLIPGGISFRQVNAGCGLTADHKGYCWESYGQPALVSGFSFNQLVRSGRICGVTTLNKAYCWGDNFTGALGDGTETNRTSPTAVLGGFLFSGVSVGEGYHTCGVTTSGKAYCWGHNAYGQLGLGSNTGPETCDFALPCSRRPRAVVGPL
jgi:alpha-tubulin suppressor-like RCC1 family protein